MNATGKIITAAVVGIAAGALAGILMAPKSGKDTRHQIRKKGEGLTDQVLDTIEEGKQQLGILKQKLETRIKEMNREEVEIM